MNHTIFNTPVIKSFLRGLSLFLFKILGWKKTGELPQEAKYVLVVAPHTSNWDVFYGVLIAFALKLDARFIAKKELFRRPFAPLMRWLGGVPIDRASSSHLVDQMVDNFNESKKFVLAVAPEGTRHKTSGWKSGFYNIAVRAHVPIVLAFIDYANKIGGAGPLIHPTGNMDLDMQTIRNFYLNVKGKYPQNTGHFVIIKHKT